MNIAENDELVKYEINLNPETIDESYLRSLSFNLQYVLKQLLDGAAVSGVVRGTQPQISALARALGNETRYIKAFERYGLTNPRTLQSKHKLDRAVANFERATGVKWPFK
tara:strand:+ start:685 stop:1014 length:330 start_codon:yes stop_codon:yes gene_type:complete